MATKKSVVDSLGSAAEAARQAYLVALNANPPGTDLSALFAKEMAAAAIFSAAADKALNGDPGVDAAQTALDQATKSVRDKLSTLKDAAAWLTALDSLVKLATTVAGFFA